MPFYSLGGNVRLMTKSATVNMMAMDSAAPEAMVEEEAAVSDVAAGAATSVVEYGAQLGKFID